VTIRPPMRCSWMMRSAFSGVTLRYHVPSGYTTQMGPPRTDAQALTLRAVEGAVGSCQVELLQTLLQVDPRFLAALEVGTIGAETYEKMTRQLPDAECSRCEFG
jgi:hypothetical protein